MSQRHPRTRDPHSESVAQWHPVDRTPAEEVLIGCPVGATIETRSSTGSRRLEGD